MLRRVESTWFLRLLARKTEWLHRLHFLVCLLGHKARNYTILGTGNCEKASHASKVLKPEIACKKTGVAALHCIAFTCVLPRSPSPSGTQFPEKPPHHTELAGLSSHAEGAVVVVSQIARVRSCIGYICLACHSTVLVICT